MDLQVQYLLRPSPIFTVLFTGLVSYRKVERVFKFEHERKAFLITQLKKKGWVNRIS